MDAYCRRCQSERDFCLELQAVKVYWPADGTCLYMDTRQATLSCRTCGSDDLALDPARKSELIEEAYRAAGRSTGEWEAILDRAASSPAQP